MTSASGVDQGGKLASPFIALLPIDGVAISILNADHTSSLIHASDATAARLEEIHFDLGEGPLFDAFETENAVLVPDLAADARWPLFLSQAHGADAAAVFAFPLALGAACVGTVLCYRAAAGGLDAAEVEMGMNLSRAVAGPAFRQAMIHADEHESDASPVEMRREVHQATGMVLLQLDVSATDAFARMRAYAFSHGSTLREVAHDVVARRLDFSTMND
jgi:GAF domain-containing protein